MKYAKIASLLIVPAIVAGILGFTIYSITGNFSGLFTHDVLESHLHNALIPFICVISIAAGFLPALFYMAAILFPACSVEIEAATEAANDIITAEPILTVGQVFENATCRMRVKAIKMINWAGADLAEYEYALNFSL